MKTLQERFSTNPGKVNNEEKVNQDTRKKKNKALKVLDAKAAQNLSVILGKLFNQFDITIVNV